MSSARDNQMAHNYKECARKAQPATSGKLCRGLGQHPLKNKTSFKFNRALFSSTLSHAFYEITFYNEKE